MAAGIVRWGIVGTGGIGRRTIGDLRLCDTADVVAVASRSQARADEFATEHGVARACGDYAQMCASPDVDAIYIGTPHSTHFAYAQEALRAGKHVLCEKPLVMTADEARVLGRLAAENDLFLMEAMWMKFSPAIQEALALVRSGKIGDPRLVQAGLGYAVPLDGPPRFWDAALGGGALYDMGVYTIALAQLFLGPPDSVKVTGQMRDDGVDLHEAYILEYESGALAQLSTSITAFVPARGWIAGSKGSIDFGEPLFSPASIKVMTGQPPLPPTVEEHEFDKEGAGYLPMFRAVNNCILASQTECGVHPIAATVDILETVELIRTQLAQARSLA